MAKPSIAFGAVPSAAGASVLEFLTHAQVAFKVGEASHSHQRAAEEHNLPRLTQLAPFWLG